MRLLTRFGSRKPDARRRPATARLRLQTLEDRALPSFGFGSAFSVGGTGSDAGFSVVRDAAGSMYVAGQFSNTVDFDPNDVNHTNLAATLTAAPVDGFVAKYAPDGAFQWVTDLGANTRSTSDQIAVQGSQVYLTYNGPSSTSTTYVGYVSALDTGTGTVNWTTTVQSTNAWAVAISPTGNLYAVCHTNQSISAPEHAIVDRLDPATGNILWTQSSGGGWAAAERLAVDNAGNVYVMGIDDPYTTSQYFGLSTFGSTTLTDPWGNDAGFVWKLNPSGGTVWAGGFGCSAGTGIDYRGSIATDNSGNVYITDNWFGGSNNFNPGSGRAVSLIDQGGQDAFILKLTPGKNGAMSLGWAKDIGGTGTDYGNAVAVDGSGNVCTTGKFNGTVNFNPNSGTTHYLAGGGIFVSKLDANGNYVAAASMAGAADGNGLGAGNGITLDGSGNVYTTGSFSGTADFDPTSGTYNLTSNGSNDVFVSVLTQTSPQLATSRGPNVGVVPLTQNQLAAVEAVAINDWAAGLPATDIAKMRSVTADVTTLSGNHLGAAELDSNEIAIDATADGWGWSVNPTAKPAANRMDLLTVVEHELGHTIGLDSRFSGDPNDLMYAYLAPGQRRLPGPADVPAGSKAVALLSAAPRPSAEDQVDWLTAIATLKPKASLYAGWLAVGQ